jgi:hypothetical protein
VDLVEHAGGPARGEFLRDGEQAFGTRWLVAMPLAASAAALPSPPRLNTSASIGWPVCDVPGTTSRTVVPPAPPSRTSVRSAKASSAFVVKPAWPGWKAGVR